MTGPTLSRRTTCDRCLRPQPTWQRERVPRRRFRSTLEATVQALARPQGPSFGAGPLLDAFGGSVADVAARERPVPPAMSTGR